MEIAINIFDEALKANERYAKTIQTRGKGLFGRKLPS
jgi:hypothetical protein